MISNVLDPIRRYEINGEVCTVQCAPLSVSTTTANTQVVAASTGQRIRVMGYMCQSRGATTSDILFRSNSSGTQIEGVVTVPSKNSGDEKPFLKPITDTGWFETSTGHALFVQVTGTDGLWLAVYYIKYTPI